MSILRSILGLDQKPAAEQPAEVSAADTTPASDPAGRVNDLVRPFLAFLEGFSKNLATERVEQLTLREAIRRFVEGRPERPETVKGALIVQPHREGKLVLWTFLNQENAVIHDDGGKPVGSRAICGSLDEELTAMLGDRELLIVE